jgi:hypothetical protein
MTLTVSYWIDLIEYSNVYAKAEPIWQEPKVGVFRFLMRCRRSLISSRDCWRSNVNGAYLRNPRSVIAITYFRVEKVGCKSYFFRYFLLQCFLLPITVFPIAVFPISYYLLPCYLLLCSPAGYYLLPCFLLLCSLFPITYYRVSYCCVPWQAITYYLLPCFLLLCSLFPITYYRVSYCCVPWRLLPITVFPIAVFPAGLLPIHYQKYGTRWRRTCALWPIMATKCYYKLYGSWSKYQILIYFL